MMNVTKTQKIIISALSVVVLILIYIVFDRNTKKSDPKTADLATTTVQTNGLGGGVTYKIENTQSPQVAYIPKPIPDLDRVVVKSPLATFVTEMDFRVAVSKVKEFQELLKKDPSNFANWMDMAMYQKAGGDYKGAVVSWLYAGKLRPTNFVSFGNLGNIYAYYLKDNAKAEVYYKEAITKSPTQAYLYLQLASVYQDVFKDMDKAREIVNEGLKQLPDDESLLSAKESLK